MRKKRSSNHQSSPGSYYKFNMIDSNRDGLIDLLETEQWYHNATGRSIGAIRVANQFLELDKNGNGFIDMNEFD